ncbi:MAG: hypothetical protein ACYC7C_05195 [Coriobacteriia bacterium]
MSDDNQPPDALERRLVMLSLFSSYYVVIEDWVRATATVTSAQSCYRMSGLSVAMEYGIVGSRSLSENAVTQQEADDVMRDWWHTPWEVRNAWADRLVYPDKQRELVVRAWVLGSPELRWLLENALVVAAKALLDTYVDQVLRLLYYFEASRMSVFDASVKISERDKRQLAEMAQAATNEETEQLLRDATSGSVLVRLHRIGEKSGVPIRLDPALRDSLRALVAVRNEWVHSWNQGQPEILGGRVVVRRSRDESPTPTELAGITFREAYAIVARVAGVIHDSVWRGVFPDETLGFFADGVEKLWGVPSEFTLEVWSDPFALGSPGD